jgi:hypothetical protein
MKELLKSPLIAITKAKKEKNINKSMLILIISWILTGLSFSLISIKMFSVITAIGIGLSVMMFGILFSIFCSYIIKIIMNILGGKGRYHEALTATAYSSFPVSLGFLMLSILVLIHPVLSIIGFIILAITTAISFSIYFKAVKEFFGTDMITVFIGFLILIYVFIIALYITMMFSVPTLPNFRLAMPTMMQT